MNKRAFEIEDRIILKDGEEKTHPIQLKIKAEPVIGYEPKILEFKNTEGKLRGVVKSNSG